MAAEALKQGSDAPLPSIEIFRNIRRAVRATHPAVDIPPEPFVSDVTRKIAEREIRS